MKKLQPGFGVKNDVRKTTSGQRFFNALTNELSRESIPLGLNPKVVLFNISAPWYEILLARIKRQKIVLRVDGLYADRLSKEFVDTFSAPISQFFLLGLKYRKLHNILAHFANFLNENFTAFFRISLAHYVVYQSEYSKRVHQKYFPTKPNSVIVNGASFKNDISRSVDNGTEKIRLVAIYDDWKPSKRFYDLALFINWIHATKSKKVSLALLGYTGRVPKSAPAGMKNLIESSLAIQTYPRFSEFHEHIDHALRSADCCISFSQRDPCPNAVIEAMSYGIPVLGIASGGMPDIVNNAGILLPVNDSTEDFFSAQRFEYSFSEIDFNEAYNALLSIIENKAVYRSLVLKRFEDELDIKVVAEKYACILRNMQ